MYVDQQHDNRSSWKNRVICICDCVFGTHAWNQANRESVSDAFVCIVVRWIWCVVFFSEFLRRWNFQCYELCNIGINVDSCLFVCFRQTGDECMFRYVIAFKATNQLNLLGAQNYRQTVSSTFIWHANPLIAMTISLCYFCQKKQQQQQIIKETYKYTTRHLTWVSAYQFLHIQMQKQKAYFATISRDNCDWDSSTHSPCYRGTKWNIEIKFSTTHSDSVVAQFILHMGNECVIKGVHGLK